MTKNTIVINSLGIAVKEIMTEDEKLDYERKQRVFKEKTVPRDIYAKKEIIKPSKKAP